MTSKDKVLWSSLGVVFALAYAQTLVNLAQRWNNTDYIHAYLVLPFAGVLVYLRQDLMPARLDAGTWWGLPLLALGILMRLFAAFTSDPVFDPLSLVPSVLGAVLVVGGWSVLRWSWPSILYLGFLVPLPNFLDTQTSSVALRRIATVASTYLLQTLSIPAMAQGNSIVLPNTSLGVEDVCSGLKTLMLFIAVCVGAALVIRRSLPEKVLVAISSIPIAVLSNVARITATGIAYHLFGTDVGKIAHDYTGYCMMPLAVALLWLEMRFLKRLIPDEDEDRVPSFVATIQQETAGRQSRTGGKSPYPNN